jgi:hypothetical protein
LTGHFEVPRPLKYQSVGANLSRSYGRFQSIND